MWSWDGQEKPEGKLGGGKDALIGQKQAIIVVAVTS